MKLYNVPQYRQDLAAVAEKVNIEPLAGKKILITGGTGLICSAVADLLIYINRTLGTEIHIFVAGRNEERARERFDFSAGDVTFLPYDALKPFDWSTSFDFIIHGASNASPELYTAEPVETMLSNLTGIRNLLDFARSTKCGRVLYISSSEVYGKKNHTGAFDESEYGYVDILNTRSSYPVAKRAAETMCKAYSSEYGVDTVMVRPGHIYGPTALKTDKRISSDFAFRAANGETLVMKSMGTQVRSYCHCLDCASAILTVLQKGENGHAYNISNPDSIITIRQMSEILAESAGVELVFDVPTVQEQQAFNQMDNSSLSSERLEALGWHGTFDARTGLAHTVTILKEMK